MSYQRGALRRLIPTNRREREEKKTSLAPIEVYSLG